MQVVKLYCQMVSAAFTEFMNRVVRPDGEDEQLAPIRYHGDPTDIYLA